MWSSWSRRCSTGCTIRLLLCGAARDEVRGSKSRENAPAPAFQQQSGCSRRLLCGEHRVAVGRHQMGCKQLISSSHGRVGRSSCRAETAKGTADQQQACRCNLCIAVQAHQAVCNQVHSRRCRPCSRACKRQAAESRPLLSLWRRQRQQCPMHSSPVQRPHWLLHLLLFRLP